MHATASVADSPLTRLPRGRRRNHFVMFIRFITFWPIGPIASSFNPHPTNYYSSSSIEVQISECKKDALTHGIAISREPFVDCAETGTSTENRKAYQKLFALAQSAERDFDVILPFHTSRWGRGVQMNRRRP
jgi:hypothetical protein